MDLVFYYEFDITYILFLVLVIVLFAFFFFNSHGRSYVGSSGI